MRQKRATLRVAEDSLRVALECREHARLAAAHVVSAKAWAEGRRSFGIELEDADSQDDLQLRFVGDALPERRRADAGRAELVARDLPREVDAIRVDAVTDEAGHRDAAVLDLRMAEEANGRFVGLPPELTIGQVERIIESDRRVEVLGERLQVGLGLSTHRERRDSSEGDLFICLLHAAASGALLLRVGLGLDANGRPTRSRSPRRGAPCP